MAELKGNTTNNNNIDALKDDTSTLNVGDVNTNESTGINADNSAPETLTQINDANIDSTNMDSNENENKVNDPDDAELKENPNNESNETKDDIYSDYNPFTPLEIPFWSKIRKCKNVLISGCGGGYDIYQGLPLYFSLKKLKNIKNVYLGNYTLVYNISANYKCFKTFNYTTKYDQIKKLIYQVNYKLNPDLEPQYFPEYYLSKWFYKEMNTDITIFTFDRWGTKYLNMAYELLIKEFNIDCVICVDGGSDSLMDGTEYQTGTITEDYTSMFAIDLIEANVLKFHVVLGVGVDRYHGTSDVSSWRAIAELKKLNGFLGGITLMNEMNEVKLFNNASEYAYKHMQTSIVGSMILDSITGHFGDYHGRGNSRVKNTQLFLYPLMGFYFIFDMNICVNRIHKYYIQYMFDDETDDDASDSVRYVRILLSNENIIKSNHENYPETDYFPKKNSDY